jgi:hypothetical protein
VATGGGGGWVSGHLEIDVNKKSVRDII